MDIDTPKGFGALNYLPHNFGPASPTPADPLGPTPHTPVRTRDGVISDSPCLSVTAATLPLIHHHRHPVSRAFQSLNQLLPPSPNITAATRSLLEVFSTDEEHCQTAIVAGTRQSVRTEAARVRKMLLNARSKSAAMTCECFECGGALLLEGGCFWKQDTL